MTYDAIENATERPRLGSFARPCPVRGVRMPADCLWATCDGRLTAHGHSLYSCSGCATWFQLLTPETGFVYVGDLGEACGAEWLM